MHTLVKHILKKLVKFNDGFGFDGFSLLVIGERSPYSEPPK